MFSTNCLLDISESVTSEVISWLLLENAFLRLFLITFVLSFLTDCAFDVFVTVLFLQGSIWNLLSLVRQAVSSRAVTSFALLLCIVLI